MGQVGPPARFGREEVVAVDTKWSIKPGPLEQSHTKVHNPSKTKNVPCILREMLIYRKGLSH